jgi:hypothetical protein
LAGEAKTSFLSVYGAGVRLECECPSLHEAIDRGLKPFWVGTAPAGRTVTGTIKPFVFSEVSRCLAPAATRQMDGLVEIYNLDEQYWFVDERWGMCEINLLKRRWRSWILPRPSLDPLQLMEAAVLSPMAHLLRASGVELLPAISIERNGWGALILSSFGIGGEVARLVRAGYRIIGQRWTALRLQKNRFVLSPLPGAIEAPLARRGSGLKSAPTLIDLASTNPWALGETAWCEAVLVVEPGRRTVTRGRVVSADKAAGIIRHVWPLALLPLGKTRLGDTAARLSQQAVCLSMELSRNEDEFVQLVEFARHRSVAKVEVAVSAALRRHFVPGSKKGRVVLKAG